MAFTVQDFHDLIRLLGQHPDWRDELRRLVLTDDLLGLPVVVRDLAQEVRVLAEAQRRTEARLEALVEAQRRTEAQLEALAEAQRRTEARLEVLAEAQERTEERLQALAEAQRRTEVQLEALAESQLRTDATLRELAEAQRIAEKRLGEFAGHVDGRFRAIEEILATLRGRDLERLYRERAPQYFGSIMEGLSILSQQQVDRLLEAAVRSGTISWEEKQDILKADVVARGRLRSTRQQAYMVVEVSWGVGTGDVERAHRRAQGLQKVTGTTLAVVAGTFVTPEARDLATTLGVVWVTDGVVKG